ncbi:hypothetical protein [Nocardia pseudobrasiliensis]|uniref:Mce-associated membrane protein n=1 Tax=Nocardia pseudobrasiliensis TaxID=45979 RepID=A0A370I6H5_9NOCA|nr:hypothetical protein [Nocardia pseudobrasiliensis]RDI66336.1 hypothetical protein DFR76_10482 [Nocardia pseudobrasiliensis]
MRKVLALMVVACAAVFGAAGVAAAEPDSAGAREAACEFVRNFESYDYRDMDAHTARMLTLTTGGLRENLIRSSSTLADLMAADQVHSEPGNVVCAVESVDGDTVLVRADAEQIMTSRSTQGQPQTSSTTMVVTERNVGGRWLASDVQTAE